MQQGNKSELRKQLRLARRSLDAEEQKAAAKNLLIQLKELPAFRSAEKIAMYLTNDGEIDPVEVMRWCWQQSKCCYVPIVVQKEQSNTLLFAEIQADTEYVENRFRILEPVVEPHQIITADQLDLVLLPLVGFDAMGNRIGMGGGFYDTTFEFVRSPNVDRPQLVGIAHECQRVSTIDAESWDIPLSTVVTDQNIYHIRESAV